MDRPSGQQTRGQLLNAATELIAERGWGRVTTRAVAERAGLPHGAVSYHFAGKQALLTEAALDLVGRSFPIEQLRAVGGLDGLVMLMRGWAAGSSPIDQMGAAVLMEAMREAGRDATVRDQLVGLLVAYRQAVAGLVRADQDRGAVRRGVEPAGLATLLAALGDGLLLHAMLDPAVDLAGAIEALGALLQRSSPLGGGLGRGRVTGGSRGRR